MINLVYLRPKDPAKGLMKGNFTDRYAGISAASVQDLFENIEKYIAKVPPTERWNMFYTINQSQAVSDKQRKCRLFERGEMFFLDIDGINLDRRDDYAPFIAEALGIPEGEMTIVASGNGLHFLVQLAYTIDSLEELNRLKPHYNEFTRKLEAKLHAGGLPGKLDPVFDQSRVLRLPLTENRKLKEDGLVVRQCRLLQTNFTPHQISIVELSGIPEVAADEQVTDTEFRREFGRPDTETILEGCEFVKWTRESGAEVKEPLGYAALSVLARLDETGEVARETVARWTGSTSIANWDVDQKIDQALGASGPRTCKNINSLWGKCNTCKYNGKVKSPITIQGPNFIRTEGTGFHDTVIVNNVPKRVPNVQDLRRFFERGGMYRVLGRRSVLRWDGTQYQDVHPMFLRAFAEEHFSPKVRSGVIDEFEDVVFRYNLADSGWFTESTTGLVNFKNKVVDWKTGLERKRDPELGFRYRLPFDFDPTAQAPVWGKFLLDIFQGDADTARLMEEFIGYCLSNDLPWKQKAMLLIGSGANGKSTLLDVMQALAGAGNYSTVRVDKFNEPTHVAMMDGKLFNVSGETPRAGFAETAGLKELSAGDAVTARRLYDAPYVLRNRAKIVFACNEIPRSLDNTPGFYRRFWVVPFNQTFDPAAGRGDAQIGEKLAAELPGIFNRCWEAYRAVQGRRDTARGDFTSPQAVQLAGAQFQEEMDVVGTWIEDHVRVSEGARVTNSELYDRFAADMRSAGHEPLLRAWSRDRLSKRVGEKVRQAERFKSGSVRGFRHIALNLAQTAF